jgi:hypothetical protein
LSCQERYFTPKVLISFEPAWISASKWQIRTSRKSRIRHFFQAWNLSLFCALIWKVYTSSTDLRASLYWRTLYRPWQEFLFWTYGSSISDWPKVFCLRKFIIGLLAGLLVGMVDRTADGTGGRTGGGTGVSAHE